MPLDHDADISRLLEPDEITLFLFSAAVWLPHRIHYDRNYSKVDGHRDLLVHGPLQGTYLVQMVEDWFSARNGHVDGFYYRHLSPAYVGRELRCRAKEIDRTEAESETRIVMEVTAEDMTTGAVTTAGEVTGVIQK
jgi:hydroxyacyl-ACP dehydratase HTD2-like protein with hotdog domain